MNYAKSYTAQPSSAHDFTPSVLSLVVVEATSSSPPRAVLRISNGPAMSLGPELLVAIGGDLISAARNVEDMRRDLADLDHAAEVLKGEA